MKRPKIMSDIWLNSEPLTEKYLEGKVVLVEYEAELPEGAVCFRIF